MVAPSTSRMLPSARVPMASSTSTCRCPLIRDAAQPRARPFNRKSLARGDATQTRPGSQAPPASSGGGLASLGVVAQKCVVYCNTGKGGGTSVARPPMGDSKWT